MDRLRQVLASYWIPISALMVGLPGLLSGLKQFGFSSVPGPSHPTTRFVLIGLTVSVLVLVRFPRFANAITRLLLPPQKLPAGEDKDRIFIGPRAFTSDDTERFFGRKRESDDCWREIQSHPFFILEGESGCGKSSLLNAGVLPKAGEKFRVIVCRVADDPFGKVRAALAGEPYRVSVASVGEEALNEALAAVPPPPGGTESGEAAPAKPLLLCLDQFEELFVTVRDEVRHRFLTFLKSALQEGRIRLVLSLRSDFVDLLMRLCREADPEQQVLDLGNYYTLRAFRREQAENVLGAMFKPLDPAENDPIRLEQIEDFRAALVQELLRPPRDKRLSADDEKTVLPVELQTVGMMLESLGVSEFSVERLRRLGGKSGLLQAFVEEAKTYVFRKTGVPPEQSLLILRQLISPAQTKWAQTPKAVAKARSLPPDQVEGVLNAFGDKYLVNRLPRVPDAEDDSSLAYEFMHEHLVQILREAPDPVLQKARDAEGRLVFWTERAEPVFAASSRPQPLRKRIASAFAQPIPFLETLRLWRYATDYPARTVLRRNLGGFARRALTVMLPVTLFCAAWFFYVRSDRYQIEMLVRDAPVASAFDPEGYAWDHLVTLRWLMALGEAGRFREVEQVTRSIQDPESRVVALTSVVDVLVEVGKVPEAVQVALEAARVARQVEGQFPQARAMSNVVVALAKVDKVPEAERIAWKNIGNDSKIMETLAEVLARAGKVSEAERVARARGIVDPDEALKRIAWVLAKAGNMAEAERVARSIRSVKIRDSALNTICWYLGDAYNVSEAERVASSIQDPESRVRALKSNAWVLTDLGKRQGAAQTALAAEKIAKSIRDPASRVAALNLLAGAFAKVGKMPEAVQAALDAERVARSIKVRDSKVAALENAAGALAEAGRTSEAEQVARSIQDFKTQAQALEGVAVALADAGKVSEAERIARSIKKSFYTFRNKNQALALERVAVALAEAGNMSEAERVVRSIQIPNNRASALESIARELTKAGKVAEAEQIAEDLVLQASHVTDFKLRSTTFAAAAKMYAVARRFRQAREICTYSGSSSFLFRNPNPPCTSEDRLDAYAFILRQHTRVTNPKSVIETGYDRREGECSL